MYQWLVEDDLIAIRAKVLKHRYIPQEVKGELVKLYVKGHIIGTWIITFLLIILLRHNKLGTILRPYLPIFYLISKSNIFPFKSYILLLSTNVQV